MKPNKLDQLSSEITTEDIAAQVASWIVRLSEDLTSTDRAALQIEFEQWQQTDSRRAEIAHKMLSLIGQAEQLRKTTPLSSARVAIEASLTRSRKFSRTRKLGVTLMLVILLAMPIWLVLQFYPVTYLLADIRTTNGEWHIQTLTDDSILTISSASAVNSRFDAAVRNLELVQGEIMIDVAHDSVRPFQVETRHGRIRALGTRFIVSLNEQTTTLTMLESQALIDISGVNSQRTSDIGTELILTAGQRVQFSNRWIGDIKAVDIREIEDAWKFRHLVVENQPLSQVLEILSSYHPGVIRYDSRELSNMKVSAVLPLDNTNKALYLLTRNFPIRTRSYTPWLIMVEAIGPIENHLTSSYQLNQLP